MKTAKLLRPARKMQTDNRQTQYTDRYIHRETEGRHTGRETHKTALRQSQIQTHVLDRHGRHREHEAENSNLSSLLVKLLQEEISVFMP